MTRWRELAVEVQIPADVSEGHAADLMREEAAAAGLLSSGLIVGDLVVQGEGARGARTYRLSFLAEHPLDVDQVASILVRRLRQRLERNRIGWLCMAYQRPRRIRPPGRRQCPGGH